MENRTRHAKRCDVTTGNPNPPASTGPSPIQDLRKLLASWAEESGAPMSRPSWGELQLLLLPLKGTPAAFWDTLLPSLPASHALLATMTIAASDAKVRASFLQRACTAAVQMPPGRAVELLKLFPKDLVLSGFGPALLSPPPLGPLAADLLARLEITIAPGDIPVVLAASSGTADTLENLARLVPREHVDTVIQDLQSQLDTSKPGIAQLRDTFVNLLTGLPNAKIPEPPVSGPDNQASAAERPPQTPPTPAPPSQAPQPESTMAQARARLAGAHPTSVFEDATEESTILSRSLSNVLPGIDRNLLFAFVAIMISIPLILFLTADTPQETPETAFTPQVPMKAPKFWTDAVTKRKITREFLAADNDFQMGEMFLIRQQYGEALSLFRDALSRDPEHVAAQFRVGFCLFTAGDNKGAAQAFRKSLEMKSDLPQANLYLARISAAALDWDQAISSYQKEFDISGDIAVALEYAGTLRKLGRFHEAITLLTSLQPRFSGHLEVVNLLAQLKDDARGLAP